MIPFVTEVGEKTAPKLGLVLHGVLGAGHNFRSFAKRLTEVRPEYRFLLVDVRHHGKSTQADGPNTLEACARDLIELIESLGVVPNVVIGHSMGGKIALTLGRVVLESSHRLPLEDIEQFWALDSDPGPQTPGEDHQVRRVMRSLLNAPGPFSARADATSALIAQGLSSGLANWLVTNLERKDEALVWKLDLASIGDLLDDYFTRDEWPLLENVARSSEPGSQFHLLVAEQSDRWSGLMRERAETLPVDGRFRLHELKDAGHWVHVDNPDGLLAIFDANLPRL